MTLRKSQCDNRNAFNQWAGEISMDHNAEIRRESITPESIDTWLALRALDITSTEVAALFGMSPYVTAFELWHQKRNAEVVKLPPNERMTWGTRLQDAIAQGVACDNGWAVRPMNEYMRIPDLRIGSSFDWAILDSARDRAILEIKNVDGLQFAQSWTETDFGIEAPAHIELQVQHQMLVSGVPAAVIGALVGGNRVVLLHREFDPEVGAGILAACAEFWQSIASGVAPTPDFRRDAAAIKRIYGYADPGRIYDGRGDAKIATLLRKYHDATTAEKAAGMDKDEARAELLTVIGDAERVLADGFKVSCGLVGPAEIAAYTRPAFRNFRVTAEKVKA